MSDQDQDLAVIVQEHNEMRPVNRGGRPPGTPQSPEVRARISAAKKGFRHSAISRIRMSEAKKRMFAQRRGAANAAV